MSTPLNVPPKSNSSTLATDKKVGDNTVSSKGDDTEVTSNFIRDIIEADLKSGKHGNAVTRFPPEPNGFLHIGHAKSICLNFGIARDYKGVCHLRFDDTNPIKEDTKYVDAIKEDVRWLGFDWGDNLFYSSDYFERLYDAAVTLISKGQAYVCGQTDDQMRATRGTVKEAGTASPDRNRAVKENLDLFARMRQGEFKDGEYTLRAKGDMSAANMKLRDWPLYRIRHTEHHRTGSTWCIYPLYDFAHCISDAIEGVTHSLCTLEFENNRALYDWILSHLDFTNPPKQTEFARLNLTYTIMSKRNLLTLVEEGLVNGWDDPRMPTIAGLRRRGVTPEAIRNFCDRIGMAKANSTVDVAQLDFSIRDDLNTKTPRVLAVLDPVKLVITNYPTTADCPQGETDWLDANYYPHDIPLEGTRKLPFTRELYIERSDFMEVPVRKYFRLAPGKEVRLRYGYLVTCTDVVKDAAGEITEIHCTYDPDSRGGNAPDGRKVKGTIHWVSAEHALDAEVRLYDRLFNVEAPGAGDTDFREQLNPDSLKTVTAKVEPSLASCKPSDRFQFERTGYFCSDSKDSSPDHLVFNRTVPLRDSWGKKKG